MRGRERITRRGTVAAGLLLALGAGTAEAAPLFASPPHFVVRPDRRQVVFFLNETVSGALAVRAGDGGVDVIVPGSGVAGTVAGERYRDDEAEVASVVLASAAHGATAIRIESAVPVGEANAHPVDDPPRLVVDLLAVAPAPTATRATRPSPAATAPPAAAPKATDPAAASAALPGTATEPTPASAPAAEATVAIAAASATPTAAPTVPPTTVPTTAPTAAAPSGPAARATPAAGGVRVGDVLAGAAAAIAPPPPAGLEPIRGVDVPAMPCLWQRRAGVPFCAPDAASGAYASDPAAAVIAQALASPGREPPAVRLPRDHPARLYLEADAIFLARAGAAKLLPAVRAYQAALRRDPDFADAVRARLNVALAYRAMGFAAELRAAAAAAERPAEAALLHALAGDAALEVGAREQAETAYAAAAAAGGIGVCLAARGRLALAFEGHAEPRDGAALAELPTVCPPEVLSDPETELLLARAKLAAGDAGGAAALVAGMRERVAPPSRARVIITTAAAAELAGRTDEARRAYEELAGGAYGARAAQSAQARLALLDAAGGDLEGGLERLGRLDAPDVAAARQTLVAEALDGALDAKASSEAIALVQEAGVAVHDLSPAAQLHLARSYRLLGLHDEAAAVLDAAGPALGAEYWEESGRLAEARAGWPGALALAERWLAARPDDPPARAARARALAGAGRPRDAIAELARAAVRLDPVAVRDLRIEIATLLRGHDLPTALGLLEEAEAARGLPALPDARAAALLWSLGDAAEAAGEPAVARDAFATLARRHPEAPEATLAAYRAARLVAALEGRTEAITVLEDAPASADALAARAAKAAREYEAIMAAFGGGEGEAR